METFIILSLVLLAILAISAYGKPERLKNVTIKSLLTSTGSCFLGLSFALLLVIPDVNAAALNKDKPTIILNGPWKFKTGDSPGWSALTNYRCS